MMPGSVPGDRALIRGEKADEKENFGIYAVRGHGFDGMGGSGSGAGGYCRNRRRTVELRI